MSFRLAKNSPPRFYVEQIGGSLPKKAYSLARAELFHLMRCEMLPQVTENIQARFTPNITQSKALDWVLFQTPTHRQTAEASQSP